MPDHLAVDAGVDVEHVAKGVRGRDQEARLLLDHAADVVGQAAVRVRDVGPALHHEDLGVLVEPAQARRARGAAGDAADDDDFHAEAFRLGRSADSGDTWPQRPLRRWRRLMPARDTGESGRPKGSMNTETSSPFAGRLPSSMSTV